MKHEKAANNKGAGKDMPAFHPGGTPRVTDCIASVEVDVVTMPAGFVMIKVARVGDGEIVGKAVTLEGPLRSIGLYVLVARSDETISPTEAVTDALNVYGGVV